MNDKLPIPVLRFDEVREATNGTVNLKANLVGACDQCPDSLQFLKVNHQPGVSVDT